MEDKNVHTRYRHEQLPPISCRLSADSPVASVESSQSLKAVAMSDMNRMFYALTIACVHDQKAAAARVLYLPDTT